MQRGYAHPLAAFSGIGRHSAKIHCLRHTLVRMAEAPLILILDCRAPRIGSLGCDFGPEHPLALLWIVVVFCARAHVVCVWWMASSFGCHPRGRGGRGRVTYNRRGLGRKRSACSARRGDKARRRAIGGRRPCSETRQASATAQESYSDATR
jgi:hypothetical protein